VKKENCHFKKKTMAGQTKMIIITSNEDLIQQLLTNNTTNRKIIDFDHDKQIAAMASHDNNAINLSFLAELSELVRIYC